MEGSERSPPPPLFPTTPLFPTHTSICSECISLPEERINPDCSNCAVFKLFNQNSLKLEPHVEEQRHLYEEYKNPFPGFGFDLVGRKNSQAFSSKYPRAPPKKRKVNLEEYTPLDLSKRYKREESCEDYSLPVEEEQNLDSQV